MLIRDLETIESCHNDVKASHHTFRDALQTMFNTMESCCNDLRKHKKELQDISDEVQHTTMFSSDEKELKLYKLDDMLNDVAKMEQSFPTENSFLLQCVLGYVNVRLYNVMDRFKYKSEYEIFKLKATLTMLTLSLALLFCHYWFPQYSWRPMDSGFNFLLLWFYSVITLREHILIANGSRIRGWWMFHHYTSIMMSALMLIWPNGPAYTSFRFQFQVFSFYICLTQLMQFRYQQRRLYTLRALNKVEAMEPNSEVVHNTKNLTILVPYLVIGHLWQLYNAYTLFNIALRSDATEWQVSALGWIFVLLGTGNLFTTVRTVLAKCSAKNQVARRSSHNISLHKQM